MVNRVQDLLEALEAFVTDEGSILGIDDVAPLVESMNNITSIESKCTFINLLLNTQKQPVLAKFVTAGGWKTLNRWLSEVLPESESDSMLVEEILHVLIKLPVTIDLLKLEKSTPLMIKNLSRNSKFNPEVQKLAAQIVKLWTEVITAETKPKKQTSNDSSVKQKAHKTKSDVDLHSDSAKVKKQHAPPSSGARKTGLEINQSFKPTSTKKRPSVEVDPTSNLLDSKKAKTDQHSSTPSSESITEKEKISKEETKENRETHSKPSKTEGSPKISAPEVKVEKVTPVSNSQPQPAVKINPEPQKPKPTPVVLTQSSLFADALFKPAAPPVKPKVKTKVKKEKSENKVTKESKDVIGMESPTKGQTESSKAEKQETKTEIVISNENSSVDETVEKKDETTPEDNKSENTNTVTESSWDPSLGPKPILVYHRVGKKTNRVKFRDDDSLVEVEYFEIEEGERTNFRKQQGAEMYQDYAKIEMMREKMTMQRLRDGYMEPMSGIQDTNTWCLIPFEYPESFDQSLLAKGTLSTERETQNRREVGVLAELHFDRSKIPASPKEPDRENFEPAEPILIPLEGDVKVQPAPDNSEMMNISSSPKDDVEIPIPAPAMEAAPSSMSTPQARPMMFPPPTTIASTALQIPVTAATPAATSRTPAQELIVPYAQDLDLRTLNNNDSNTSQKTQTPSLRPMRPPDSRGGFMNPANGNFGPHQPMGPRNPGIPGAHAVTVPIRPPVMEMMGSRPRQMDPSNNGIIQNRNPNQPFTIRPPPPPIQIKTRMDRPPFGNNYNPNYGHRGFHPNIPRARHSNPMHNGRFRSPFPEQHANQRPRAPQPSARPSLDASQVCFFHAQGHCKNGDRCKLVHVPRGAPPTPDSNNDDSQKDIDLRQFFN
ncbi:serine/threonine-protein phosphatase 1 regulatory subunit 10-like [Convolutriloba macropyga]|uniref:serine/threonine-protein phosphatase 1 regulatory subunit 10-like n=1 Tax=Convolutriloba macropyga TaxID=536237 RepID=UPI003F528DD2